MSDSAVTVVASELGGSLRPSAAGTPSPTGCRVRVTASGMCDAEIVTGAGTAFTPGREVADVLPESDERVEGWSVGDRVAVGHRAFRRSGGVVHCPALALFEAAFRLRRCTTFNAVTRSARSPSGRTQPASADAPPGTHRADNSPSSAEPPPRPLQYLLRKRT